MEHGLARDGQRLAAGGQDPEAGRALEQSFGEPGGAVDEVLRVVEEQQDVLVGEERGHGRGRGDARDLGCAQCAGDLGRDLRRIAQWGQLGQPDTVRESVEEMARRLEHQPRLARPTRPDQGDQPMLLEQGGDLAELLVTADEARQLYRQVRAARAERAERGERTREVLDDHLVHLLGSVDIAQAVGAQVDQLDGRRQPIAGEDGGDRRADDLAAVGDGEDPGDAVEGGAEVVPVARLRLARVEGHPDAQLAGLAPSCRAKRPLGSKCGVDGGDRVGEHRQDPIARRLDHSAAIGLDRGTEEPVVLGERRGHLLGVLLPETRAAFDVGEQERRQSARPMSGGRAAGCRCDRFHARYPTR